MKLPAVCEFDETGFSDEHFILFYETTFLSSSKPGPSDWPFSLPGISTIGKESFCRAFWVKLCYELGFKGACEAALSWLCMLAPCTLPLLPSTEDSFSELRLEGCPFEGNFCNCELLCCDAIFPGCWIAHCCNYWASIYRRRESNWGLTVMLVWTPACFNASLGCVCLPTWEDCTCGDEVTPAVVFNACFFCWDIIWACCWRCWGILN